MLASVSSLTAILALSLSRSTPPPLSDWKARSAISW